MSQVLSSDVKRRPLSSSTSSLRHLQSRSASGGSDRGDDEFLTVPPALKYSKLEGFKIFFIRYSALLLFWNFADSSSLSVRLASPFLSAAPADFELLQARAKVAQLDGKVTSLNRLLAEERALHDAKREEQCLEQQVYFFMSSRYLREIFVVNRFSWRSFRLVSLYLSASWHIWPRKNSQQGTR